MRTGLFVEKPKRRPPLDTRPRLPYPGAIMAEEQNPNYKVIAENRRARFDYFIESDLEVGIILTGSEVKSLRTGQSNIAESYASVENNGIFLINAHIPEYAFGTWKNHATRRNRKLLLHRKEIGQLTGAVDREGMTIVPLKIYFNDRGRAKVELALARGRKAHDKRQAIKAREWSRDKARLMRERG